jgi:uncharacterized SAM-binding protein YcdF (DUF218 family)
MQKLFKVIVKQLCISLLILLALEAAVIGSGLQHSVGRWLQVKDQPGIVDPDWIVVLGGGGIPSETGLIRCYYGAEAWKQYPDATCIVSLPADGDPETSSVGLMKQELIMRGVPESKIEMETNALNTRQQAKFIADMFGEAFTKSRVVIVTTPYHLRRSFNSFRDVGCTEVGVMSASSIGAEADFGGGGFFRYTIWGILEGQAVILRELVALAWYKVS